MEFDTVIKKRKSVRGFVNKKVNWKDVLTAIDSANQVCFAGNENNFKYMIIEDEKTILNLAKHSSQTWINEANLVVVVCSDDTHLENLYGERGRIYSRQQAGAAIQTLLFKLTDLGLFACWVGSFSDEFIKHALGIPQHIQVEAIVPIGYPDKTEKIAKRKKKKELGPTLFWGRWLGLRKPTPFEEPRSDYRTSLTGF